MLSQWPEQRNSVMSLYLSATRHSYPLASFHISAHFTVHHITQWQSHSLLTVLHVVWLGLYATQLIWNNLFSALCAPRWWAAYQLLAVEQVRRSPFSFLFLFFFNCFGKGEAVNAHKTVWCVTKKHKQKRDKSDIKGFSYSVKQGSSFTFFFFVVVAITVLCYFYCSNL